ncbi:hypothetical protein LX32DRAFT_119390 [Colletotrichum zoysiae]|uniref:Uncharacterized protein n=1 Tax=Colletotrichum zoysiae TaxID=1216348 RepID=A0AAD9H877_9PEZI|nr:hypothetical protein LX32DRAFT_119390 [Colletotrichum zoysiae]
MGGWAGRGRKDRNIRGRRHPPSATAQANTTRLVAIARPGASRSQRRLQPEPGGKTLCHGGQPRTASSSSGRHCFVAGMLLLHTPTARGTRELGNTILDSPSHGARGVGGGASATGYVSRGEGEVRRTGSPGGTTGWKCERVSRWVRSCLFRVTVVHYGSTREVTWPSRPQICATGVCVCVRVCKLDFSRPAWRNRKDIRGRERGGRP